MAAHMKLIRQSCTGFFPPTVAQRDAQHMQSNDTQQAKFAPESSYIDRVVELEKELAVAHERANGLEAQKDQMADTINDLRKRLDSSETPRDGASGRQQPKAQLLVALEAILTKGRNADGADVALICVSTSRQIAIFLTSTSRGALTMADSISSFTAANKAA